MPVALFDLDGTITDPQLGIISAYQEVMREWGLEPLSVADLLWVIGPPLRVCLPKVLNLSSHEDVERAVVRYRHYYVTEGAMYRDTPYPGVKECLDELAGAGVRMFVATAKAHTYAGQILEHWNLRRYFAHVHGSELDGTRSSKTELVKHILKTEVLDARDCVMIGDRAGDFIAARDNAMHSIGVTYGYGTSEEYAIADHCCAKPQDLAAMVLNVLKASRS